MADGLTGQIGLHACHAHMLLRPAPGLVQIPPLLLVAINAAVTQK